MRRFTAIAVWAALVTGAHYIFLWGTGLPLEVRSAASPAFYYGSIAAMLFCSLLALGAASAQGALEAGGLSVLFQTAALAACLSRQPGHALAAQNLLLSVTAPSLILAFLAPRSDRKFIRVVRLLALLAFSGLPPFPGFFARVEVLSAIVHSEWTWLAVWTALTQAATAIAVIRIVFEEYLPESAGETGTA